MIFLLVALVSTVQSKYTEIDTFIVDLDKPAETRWNEVLLAKSAEIHKTVAFIDSQVNSLVKKNIAALVLKGKIFSEEILNEIKGGSKLLNIDFNTLLLGNFINEFYAACSSILIRQTDGSVILGRNLDYFLRDNIRDLVVQIEFFKGGKLLYKAVTFASYFGVLTGMRPDAFAMSLNQRDLFDMHWIWEATGILSGSQATAFAMRHALESFSHYDDALEYLKSVPIISGEYICLAGLVEGAIITRNRKYVADLLELDEEKWFIVQTNYDHWLPQPEKDDRYHPAIKRIEEIGQEHMNEQALFEVLSSNPTNNDKTLYSTIMNPTTSSWRTMKWESN